MFGNGLFGWGGMNGMNAPVPPQLAGFYDQEAMRKAKIKSTLLNAGLSMLGQGPSQLPINFGTSLGQGLAAGVKAGDEVERDYRDMAYQTFGIQNDMDDRKYRREQDAMERDWRKRVFEYGVGRDNTEDAWKRQQWDSNEERRLLENEKLRADVKKAQTVDARARLGLNPQYGTDASGNPVLLQIGEDGAAIQTKMPDGVTLSKEPIKLDAGTHFVLLDPITRQPVSTIPKDIAGQAQQEVEGKFKGEKRNEAPAAIQSADNALMILDKIENDPYKSQGTGLSSLFNPIPGTGGHDFQALVDQSTSDAFLKAIESMEGFGALSNQEGQTARAAVSRMKTSLSEGAFNAALNDYKMIVRQGKAKAMARLGATEVPQPKNTDGQSLKKKYGLE
jgi:hypothetical protein